MKDEKPELQIHISDLIFVLKHLETTYNENPENQDWIDCIEFSVDIAIGRVKKCMHRIRLKNNAINKLKEM